MKTISKIAWIHIEDRKVLMVRTRGKDAFYFPGGKPEKLESNAQALERELREELGIAIDIRSVKSLGPPFKAPAHGAEDTMLECMCCTATFTGTPAPHSEIEELRYFSWDQRESLTPVALMVFDFLHTEGHI